MKKILAATKPEDITVTHNGKYVAVCYGGTVMHHLFIGDSVKFKAASFITASVPEEIYWTVRAQECLGGNF